MCIRDRYLSTSYREVCMAIDEKLAELGIVLPEAAAPVGSYVPVKLTGNLAFVSGMLPTEGSHVKQTGRVGESVTTQEAYDLARICAVNGLAALKGAIGTLDRVKGIAMVQGFVQAAPDYAEVPKVCLLYTSDAADDLLCVDLGGRGIIKT